MFTYDRLKEAERVARGEDHCKSAGRVHELGSLMSEGVICDPADRSVSLTAGRSVGSRSRVLIYAIGENFEIRVGFDGKRGTPDAVKHETLFNNADVRAAGELEVEDGVIVEVGDVSGTYGTPGRIQTDDSFATAVLIAIDRIGAPLQKAERLRLQRRAGRP